MGIEAYDLSLGFNIHFQPLRTPLSNMAKDIDWEIENQYPTYEFHLLQVDFHYCVALFSVLLFKFSVLGEEILQTLY